MNEQPPSAENDAPCTCTDPAVACPTCLAGRDSHGWPKNWRERMGEQAAAKVAAEQEARKHYAAFCGAEAELARLRAVMERAREVLAGWEHDGPDDFEFQLLIRRVRQALDGQGWPR